MVQIMGTKTVKWVVQSPGPGKRQETDFLDVDYDVPGWAEVAGRAVLATLQGHYGKGRIKCRVLFYGGVAFQDQWGWAELDDRRQSDLILSGASRP